ncbi:MAG: hypothetical protein VKJ46_15295 [Leptolyngbyaceae bacterium]|nr:hypothetical protein [Leptolyngbyaceae bacterium]
MTFEEIQQTLAQMLSIQRQLQEGQLRLQEGQLRFQERQAQLQEGQEQLQEGQAQLQEGQAQHEQQITSLFQGLLATNEVQRGMIASIERLERSVERLEDTVERFATKTDQQFARHQELIESLAASEERQERLLEYVMRRVEER